jgi:3'5'-cyclic nucleotide phosphodiesterase
MEPQYNEWRATIFTNECERHRFRQLVVNSVLATDIVDKTLRNARWDKAFKPEQVTAKDINPRDAVYRKATIVIEHLIQASDVSHTMQHWHVFRKWSQRLFKKCMRPIVPVVQRRIPRSFGIKVKLGFLIFTLFR